MDKRPPWLRAAYMYLGLKEIAGTKHNSTILKMWSRLTLPYRDDETPWCAAFVGSCLEEVEIKSTRSAWALSYQNYGFPLDRPALGCIATKKRFNSKGKLVGGHVTFIAGKTKLGMLLGLGGNQNNQVSLAVYSRGEFNAFRWPVDPKVLPPVYELPTLVAGVKPTSEA